MNGGITARSLPIDSNGGRRGNPISRRRISRSLPWHTRLRHGGRQF